MDAALISVLGVALAGLLAMVQLQFNQVNRRIDRLTDELHASIGELRGELGEVRGDLAGLKTDLARIGQQLDDHLTDHPGPTERLVH
jgi:hypothetical protein